MFINPFMLVIALFVWVGAAAEASAVQFKAGLAGVPVILAMIRNYATLAPDDTLGTAAKRTLDGFQYDFPVVVDGMVVGNLPRTEFFMGLTEAGMDGHVEDFMRTDFAAVEPDEMVELVFERLKDGACPVLPVIQGNQLLGLLTMQNVAELVTIREAVRGRKVPTLALPIAMLMVARHTGG
jgi:predicted transcriptional regulator